MGLLSVVVPMYGVERYVHDCLESIRVQDYPDLEVVMLDDGSPDRSAEIARTFADRDPRFVLYQQENQGIGRTRNNAVDLVHGKYFTFVDSDDLVPPNAFKLLVETLEATGSSIVGGNAVRFNVTSGVRPSWSHLKAFSRTQLATHINTNPALSWDRMVWNKVYRKDFWDEFGFRFPPIRYEDFPVAFAASVNALSFDIRSEIIYYWRERESGDSITQQAYQYGNLHDRVTSAEIMLTEIPGASPAAMDELRRHFAEVDFVTVMQCFADVPAEEEPRLLELAQHFTSLLPDHVIRNHSAYNAMQLDALHREDIPVMRSLAEFRARHAGPNGLPLRSLPKAKLPGMVRSVGVGRLAKSLGSKLRLKATATATRSTDEALVLELTSRITGLPPSVARRTDAPLTLELVGGRTRIPLDLVVAPGQWAGERVLQGSLRWERLREFTLPSWPLRFELTATFPGFKRRTGVPVPTVGSVLLAEGHWLDGDVWVQPARGAGGMLGMVRMTRPAILRSAEQVCTSGAPTLRLVCEAPFLLLDPSLEVREGRTVVAAYPMRRLHADDETSLVAEIDVPALLANHHPLDPFTQRTEWDLSVAFEGGRKPMVLEQRGRDLVVDAGNDTLALVANAHHVARLVAAPPRTSAFELAVADGAVEVRGGWCREDQPERLEWRRYLPASDDFVAVPTDLELVGADYVATTPLADFELPPPDTTNELSRRWSLFAVGPGGEHAVRCESVLTAALPVVADAERGLRATTHAYNVVIEVV